MGKRIARQRLLSLALSLLVALPLSGGLAASPSPPITVECASPASPQLSLSLSDVSRDSSSAPTASSFADLIALAPPPAETQLEPTVWTVQASVQRFALIDNGTIQAVLADLDDPRQTLIAHVVDPACTQNLEPGLGHQLGLVRDTLEEACGRATTSLQPCGALVRAGGVGGFVTEGQELSTDAAPNGFELSPVLLLQPLIASTPGPSVVPSTTTPLTATPVPTSPTVTATPLPIATLPLNTRGRRTLSGTGSEDSVPFILDAGSYSIAWVATAPETETVNFAAFIKPSDPLVPGWIFVDNSIIWAGGRHSGVVQAPRVAGGMYYLSTIGASSWTVTITLVAPQPEALNPPVGVSTPTLTPTPPLPFATTTPGTPVTITPTLGPPRILTPRPRPTLRPFPTIRPRR